MSEIPLNKFEKEKRVIELHLEGKTIRAIAPIVHMSFRDISKIIKAYDKKRLQESKNEQNIINQKIKERNLSSKIFKLFSQGKKPTEIVIKVRNITPAKVEKLFSQFLKSERMYECYEFYQMFQYEMPQFLAISSFIRNNEANISSIANILKEAHDVHNLQLHRSRLNNEIARLKQIIKNRDYEIKPLPNINWGFPPYHF